MSQKKKGFYLDDEDSETASYLNGQPQQALYRDRDFLNAGSPSSQIFTSSNQIYQPSLSRGYNGNTTAFQRSTPTSMLQPQSPNRNLLGSLAQRNFPTVSQSFHNLPQQQSLQKRLPTNYGQFNQPSFGFQSQQQSRTSGLSSSSNDMPSSSQINSIDLSAAEFPSLTNKAIPQPNLTPGIRNYVGMVGGNSKSVESGGEFSMQQEDFPALPGSTSVPNGPDISKPTSTENTMSKESARNESKTLKGVQSLPDGSVTNIPNGMVTDQFGMIGLLTFLRAAETDGNLVALAPGVDLTSLGLNLNSPEPLYSTFQSPWAEGPCRPQDIDYHVPSEYLTNMFIREKLSPIKLNKYGEDLLFYLFYSNPGDVLQIAASTELYNREWRYHREEQVWITRVPGVEPVMKSNTYERGSYYVFEPNMWRKSVKEFHLEYSKLEERPQGIPVGNSQHGSNSALANH